MSEDVSREYVLTRLDKWYSAKFERVFTEADGKTLEGIAMRALDSVKSADEEAVEEIRKRIPQISRDALITQARTYFSKWYHQIETSLSLESYLSTLPRGVREEYFQGIQEAKKQLDDFVNSARRKADEICPDELSDEHINKAFLRVFGGWEGYVKSYESTYQALLLMINYYVSTGQAPQIMLDFHERFFDLTKDFFKELSKRMVDS